MELVLSIYGAALATILGLAQLWSRRTRLKLRVNPGRATVAHRSDGGGGQIAQDGNVVFMQITNRSGHPVKITMVGGNKSFELLRILFRRPGKGFIVARPLPLTLSVPFVIEPRDNVMIWFDRDALDAERRTVFAAYTADGRVARTRPIKLSKRPELAFHGPGIS